MTNPSMKNRNKENPARKNMKQDKDTIEEHKENEEVKPVGEPFSPEISSDPEPTGISADLSDKEILQAELAEVQDKFRRLYAEFDNFRKRSQRERLELFKTSNSEIMLALLPVLDDFERAIKAMESNTNEVGIKDGVMLIFHKLKSTLEQKGLKRMESIGQKFDVDLHDAITNVPVESKDKKGTVIDEAECGYFLNDKVIRHAKVIVGS